MTRSNYNYNLKEFSSRNCLFIFDENRGGMSVTNDIENVVKEIAEKERINPAEYMIIYRDSDGVWDGWNHKTQQFVPLNCENQYHAMDRYINLQLNDSNPITHHKTDSMKPDELKRSFDPGDEQEEDDEQEEQGAEESTD